MLDKSTFNLEYFGSLDEALAASRTLVAGCPNTMFHESLQTRVKEQSWFGPGVTSAKKVMELVANGWPSGVKKLGDMAGKIDVPPARDVRRRNVWSADEGHTFSVEQALAGSETPWRRRRKAAGPGPQRLRICIPMSASSDTPSEHLFARGAAAVVLASVLEQAGHSVEIVGAIAAYGVWPTGPRPNFGVVIMLKPADTSLSLNALAATACLGGFYRTVGFMLKVRQPWRASSHLGTVVYGTGAFAEMLPDFPGRTIVVDKDAIRDLDDAGEWVNAAITQIESEQAA